jgi:hypothetical protein
MGSIAPPKFSRGRKFRLDTTTIPCRINYMPHGSTVAFSVVARLAFACLFQVNAYRGSLRYPGWFSRPPWGIILFNITM